jgi:hypothetical protein
MATKQVNLAKVFGSVASALAGNQEALNQADTFNHDHGDNMVEVFEVVTQAMKEKKGASAAASHTGSLAGSKTAWEALREQTGAILVRHLEEFMDILTAFYYLPRKWEDAWPFCLAQGARRSPLPMPVKNSGYRWPICRMRLAKG